jgi:hypothetical protein
MASHAISGSWVNKQQRNHAIYQVARLVLTLHDRPV